jgi:hypothetical protein
MRVTGGESKSRCGSYDFEKGECSMQLTHRTVWIGALVAIALAVIVLAVVYSGGGGGGGGGY